MSRRFDTSFVVPYRGAIRSQPVNFCGGAKAISLEIPWRSYGIDLGTNFRTMVNPGIRVTWENSPAEVLASPQGVFIDNTACDSPVYFVCNDTGHMVTCPDGSSGFFPLLTDGHDFAIYIESIAAPYDNRQSTRIILCDKPFPAYPDAQFNEFIPATQISGDNAFAREVQGDQYAYQQVTLQTQSYQTGFAQSGQTQIVPADRSRPNTLVVTHIFMRSAVEFAATQRFGAVRLFRDDGTLLFRGSTWLKPYNTGGTFGNGALCDIQGAALRMPGTQAINADMTLQGIIPGTSGGNDGTCTFVADISLVYARIATPTA